MMGNKMRDSMNNVSRIYKSIGSGWFHHNHGTQTHPLHITVISLLAVILLAGILFNGGCSRASFAPPPATTFVGVNQVTVEEISAAYQADPIKADARYKGQRLVFNSVEVEEVHSIYYQSGGAINTPMVDYFRAGMVRFELLDYRGAQQRVQTGFILNLDGICLGLQGGLVNISECWVGSVKGDLGLGQPNVIGY
jgi:hypothetical protein